MVFMLPDTLAALAVVERELKAEFDRARDQYEEFREECEPGQDPEASPAFYRVLVAHRKWQHAVEKKHLKRLGFLTPKPKQFPSWKF